MFAPEFNPIAFSIGPLAVHWYGLMYLLGFAFFWALGRLRAKDPWRQMTANDVEDILFYGVLGVILGGRLGFCFFSQPEWYLSHPLDIFKVWQGGMSAHGGIIGSIAITLFLFFFNPKGDASKFSLPAFRLIRPDTWGTLFTGWTTTALIFVLLVIAWSGVQALSSSIVITMTADCADYEVYRTGKYVPGLMGTLFSFVDKLVSSLAATVVALFYSMVGFKDALPDTMTPYSDGIFWATIGCFVLLPIVGWLCNVVAMHFYPLTKEKMEEIQAEIGRIKAEAAAKQA